MAARIMLGTTYNFNEVAAMSNQDEQKKGGADLALKIKRVRTRLAANVKTGSVASGRCNERTDPTDNETYVGGTSCPGTVIRCML